MKFNIYRAMIEAVIAFLLVWIIAITVFGFLLLDFQSLIVSINFIIRFSILISIIAFIVGGLY